MIQEILLDYSTKDTNFDYHFPSEAVNCLKSAVGQVVDVSTETMLYRSIGSYPFPEIKQAVRQGSLVDVRPGEIIIFQESDEGGIEVVLPVGASKVSDDENSSGDDPVKIIEDYIKSITIGDQTFTLIDPGLRAKG